MKELNYRFKSIEEKIINGKEVHKVNDIFDNKELFVEKFKEIPDMDWDKTSKIEDELNKLKDDKTIKDFFYNNDYDRDLKIFYKVFENYDGYDNTPRRDKAMPYPEEAEKNKKEVNRKLQENNKIIEEQNKREEEEDKKIREQAENQLKEAQKYKEEAEKQKKEYEESIKNLSKEQLNKMEEIDKEVKEKIARVHKLNELGGSVKLNITTPTPLKLDHKKTTSRAEMNNKIICKICEQPLKKEKLDMENNIGYCENCHAIRQIKTLNQEEIARKNISIVAPDGIIVNDMGSKLHIETQLNIKSGFMSIFVAIVMSVLASINMSSDNIVALIFILFAIGIGYSALIDIFNKIYIDVTKQSIIIKSKPLPHFPMKVFASSRISQIYVKEYVHRNKNSTSYSYKVRAILKNGKDQVLVKLDNPDYALYLERSIESWLRIEDRHINGEYK